jgi:hypothetical protein
MSGEIIGVDLNIDKNYIKGAVEDIVRASIVQALGDPSELVKKAVATTINTKVDKNGNPSSHYGTPYLKWLAEETVKKVVVESMREIVEEESHTMKEEMKRQMASTEFRENASAAFLEAVLGVANDRWKMPLTISFEKVKTDEF